MINYARMTELLNAALARPTPQASSEIREDALKKWQRKYFSAGISHEMWPKAVEHAFEAGWGAALAACAREALREVNADAEADMLKGNPITGAHHRAIERKLAALERAAGERAGDLRVKS